MGWGFGFGGFWGFQRFWGFLGVFGGFWGFLGVFGGFRGFGGLGAGLESEDFEDLGVLCFGASDGLVIKRKINI